MVRAGSSSRPGDCSPTRSPGTSPRTLRTVYLPTVIKGSNSNGNWELSMMEAAVGISVFLNDRTSYNAAVSRYLNRIGLRAKKFSKILCN
jgi:hypothetical protein